MILFSGHLHTPGGSTTHSHIASTPAPVFSAPMAATPAAQSSSESNHDGAANALQNATASVAATPAASAGSAAGEWVNIFDTLIVYFNFVL